MAACGKIYKMHEATCTCTSHKDLVPIRTNAYELVQKLAVCFFVQNVESPLSAALFPVLSRGLVVQVEAVTRTCYLIDDNVFTFVEVPGTGTLKGETCGVLAPFLPGGCFSCYRSMSGLQCHPRLSVVRARRFLLCALWCGAQSTRQTITRIGAKTHLSEQKWE